MILPYLEWEYWGMNGVETYLAFEPPCRKFQTFDKVKYAPFCEISQNHIPGHF